MALKNKNMTNEKRVVGDLCLFEEWWPPYMYTAH